MLVGRAPELDGLEQMLEDAAAGDGGLRIVHGDATDLVLPDEDSAEFKSLARGLGYKESDRVKASAQLHGDAPAPSSKARREMLRIRRPPDCNLPCFRHE